MRMIFILFFTSFFLNVFSQEMTSDKIFISDSLTGESGKYYMEGKEINISKTFLDPKNIKKIESYFGKTAQIRSGTSGAYLITRIKEVKLISLQKFVEKIKSENQSINKLESLNVIVDNFLIQDLSEYTIEESCVLKVNILLKDPKGVNRDGTKPTIQILTNIKNNGY